MYGNVIDAGHRFAKKRFRDKYTWEASQEIEAAIVKEVFGIDRYLEVLDLGYVPAARLAPPMDAGRILVAEFAQRQENYLENLTGTISGTVVDFPEKKGLTENG